MFSNVVGGSLKGWQKSAITVTHQGEIYTDLPIYKYPVKSNKQKIGLVTFISLERSHF